MRVDIARRLVVRGRSWGLRCLAMIALLAATTGTARGQVAHSFEELRAKGLLTVGDEAVVVDLSGKTVRGTVDVLADGSLTLRTRSGRTERIFSEADVRRIRRPGAHAMVVSTLVGAGASFAVTTAAAASYGANEGGQFCTGCLVQWSTVTVPVGAGVGALVGLAINRWKVKTVYAAPGQGASLSIAPIVSGRSLGTMASIRF